MSHSRVGNLIAVDVDVREPSQVLEMREPLVTDLRLRDLQALQFRHVAKVAQTVVRDVTIVQGEKGQTGEPLQML